MKPITLLASLLILPSMFLALRIFKLVSSLPQTEICSLYPMESGMNFNPLVAIVPRGISW